MCCFSLERKVYFICDVPHLIKTTRNNLENSQWNKKTRNLLVYIYPFYIHINMFYGECYMEI